MYASNINPTIKLNNTLFNKIPYLALEGIKQEESL